MHFSPWVTVVKGYGEPTHWSTAGGGLVSGSRHASWSQATWVQISARPFPSGVMLGKDSPLCASVSSLQVGRIRSSPQLVGVNIERNRVGEGFSTTPRAVTVMVIVATMDRRGLRPAPGVPRWGWLTSALHFLP